MSNVANRDLNIALYNRHKVPFPEIWVLSLIFVFEGHFILVPMLGT